MDGLIGKKLGMTQVYSEDGRMHAVTVVEAGPCPITQVKTDETDGYRAVQLGFGTAKRLSLAEKGHLGYGGLGRDRKETNQKGATTDTAPRGMLAHLREFPLGDDETAAVGDLVTADIFESGQRVDVIGISKGKGFAGGVKRHHFHGGPKTHGQSDRHRAPGSIGSGTTPGRVLKGLSMAGHLGAARITAKNLTVLRVDSEKNLLLLVGAVPGPTDGIVLVRKAKG